MTRGNDGGRHPEDDAPHDADAVDNTTITDDAPRSHRAEFRNADPASRREDRREQARNARRATALRAAQAGAAADLAPLVPVAPTDYSLTSAELAAERNRLALAGVPLLDRDAMLARPRRRVDIVIGAGGRTARIFGESKIVVPLLDRAGVRRQWIGEDRAWAFPATRIDDVEAAAQDARIDTITTCEPIEVIG